LGVALGVTLGWESADEAAMAMIARTKSSRDFILPLLCMPNKYHAMAAGM
jgi:hypothetical protein